MKPLKILLIDNYDSFTYNLYDYFLQLDCDCSVIRNDEIPFHQIHELSFDALALSPGPKKPKDAGFLMKLIDYYHDKVPILGICLGHQGLGEYFDASLQKAIQPMHGKTSTIKQEGHPLFKNLPEEYKVMRYHSLLLKELDQTPLVSIAHTDENENMAIAHPELPLYGVQFHPESILTEHGLQLLDNWLRLVRKHLIVLREMKTEEADAVANLIIRTQALFNKASTSPEGQTHLLNNIFAADKLLERRKKGNCIMLATIKDELLGMAEYRKPGHLKLLFVEPAAHGLGIGQQLTQYGIDWTRKHFPETEFMTVSSAPTAVDFYSHCGFEATDEMTSINGITFLPMRVAVK